MLKNKKTKRFIASLLIAVFISVNLNVAQAYFTIPTSSSIASEMERRYNLDQSTIRDYSQSMNVTNMKSNVPEVLLFFDTQDPKVGEKITATAQTMFFADQQDDLYFTWYIKRNGSGNDVEDWKEEAARIIANNNFETRKANYSDGGDDPDNDGYQAKYGGDNTIEDTYANPADNKKCYIHDFETGENYELTHSDLAETTPKCSVSSQTPTCLQNRKGFDINSLFQQFGQNQDLGYIDSSDGHIHSGQNYGNATNDPAEVNQCINSNERPVCWNGSAYCYASRNENGEGTYRALPKCLSEDNLNKGVIDDANKCESSSAVSNLTTPSCANEKEPGDSCKKRHLFPKPSKTGDGDFDTNEEDDWGTNPFDPNTANYGKGDEANVVGLGINEFTWNYKPGDQVGVVVEGTSMLTTKHNDGSSMIMWALPNNECEVKDKGSYTKRVKGQESSGGTGRYFVEIPTAAVDIDKCLEDNLVDPREGGQSGNLEVELSYSPKDLRNDPFDSSIDISTTGITNDNQNLGDIVTVQAFVSNASKSQDNVCYEWWVQANSDYDTDWDNWETICCPETSSCLADLPAVNGEKDEIECNTSCEFSDITPLVGNDLSSLRFKLNLDDEWFNNNDETYLRVNARAVEHYEYSSDLDENEDNNTREGQSDVIMKVISSKDTIDAYSVDVTVNNVTNKPTDLSLADPICDCEDPTSDDCDMYGLQECKVAPNEIIGVSVDDTGLTQHSWTLNGKSLYCNSSVSSFCAESASNVNFFPVTGTAGEIFTVKYSGTNPKTGKSVKLSRRFRLVEPKVKILPVGDGARRKLLGKFNYFGSECKNNCEDYSNTLMETDPGNTVELEARFSPGFIGKNMKGRWTIDGATFDEFIEGDISNLSFAVDKDYYESYLIGFDGTYNQSDEIRNALYHIWGVRTNTTTERVLGEQVVVEVSDVTLVAQNNQKGFMASITSNVGIQLMFMLKVSLLVFVLIIVFNFIHMLSYAAERGLRK